MIQQGPVPTRDSILDPHNALRNSAWARMAFLIVNNSKSKVRGLKNNGDESVLKKTIAERSVLHDL